MTEWTQERWDQLRAPFDESDVNLLPKGKGSGDEITCAVCGNRHKERGIFHVPYVGHARVTNRLNNVDPEWVLKPGPITIDRDLAYMPVALTVLGITKYEVGCADTEDDEYVKQLYSDAITRAAMRFGVGLDLWMKVKPGEERGSPRRVSRAAAPIPKDVGPPLKDLFDVAKNRVQALSTDGGKAEWEDFKAEVDWDARWRAGSIDRNLVEMALRTLAEILANERAVLGEEPF